MLKATSRRLIIALAAGALTMSGTATAAATADSPAAVQRAGNVNPRGAGDINPLCMLRPQDCMYPPDDRNGDGNKQPSPDADGINPLCMLRPQDCMYPPDDRKDGDRGGMNPMCMYRPQDCWPPPGHHGKGDHDRWPSPGGGRTSG